HQAVACHRTRCDLDGVLPAGGNAAGAAAARPCLLPHHGPQDDLHRAGGVDRGRARGGSQRHAHLPGAVLPHRSGFRHPRFPPEDFLRRGPSGPPRAAGRDHPVLARPSMRDRIFHEMEPAWKDCYGAGIYTEFMEQRAPGHTALGDVIYRKGMLDLKEDIAAALARLDFVRDREAWDKQQELKAMAVAADAVIRFGERHAEKAREMAASEADPRRRAELERIAEVCSHVPAHAPRDFWEALQYYWFVHLGVITELNTWDSFCPGRLDQHLFPFYRKGLADGTLTREGAQELLE